MSHASVAQKLADPGYLDRHLVAAAIIRQISEMSWYDSTFLRRYEAAKRYLAAVRPEAVDRFVQGFDPLRPPRDFAPIEIKALLGEDRHAELVRLVRDMPSSKLEQHELGNFGRHILHDHPPFMELQRQLVPLVSELVGTPVEPGYNFLSLYGRDGRCEPHMDQPVSMYTLDYCIDQSLEWPIHFSQVVDWPSLDDVPRFDAARVREDDRLRFEAFTLQPDAALLFCGSSQWHYRDPMPQAGFCNLLFLHFFPAGQADLVRSARWVEHFDLPELDALIDLFQASANPMDSDYIS